MSDSARLAVLTDQQVADAFLSVQDDVKYLRRAPDHEREAASWELFSLGEEVDRRGITWMLWA